MTVDHGASINAFGSKQLSLGKKVWLQIYGFVKYFRDRPQRFLGKYQLLARSLYMYCIGIL